jgi:hypothetical protein
MVPPFFDFLQAFTIQDVADIFQLARPLSHLALLDARFPLLSLRDIFPRRGGSLSSKGEPLAVHASFISLPRPLPLGEVSP